MLKRGNENVDGQIRENKQRHLPSTVTQITERF